MHAAATRLFLVRHGETDWNVAGRWQGQTDIPLNEAGRAQARELARRMRGEGIATIAASDLLRARETAEIVAAELGLEVRILDHRLREQSFGAFEGLT
ncbi:MAG TPA: histidine phosphatase family protein, partial [Anaeromyxobacteraceae bacterium]|nr:histidine phosphatase family protein [Anaeromyxobacteraceae bacterium]